MTGNYVFRFDTVTLGPLGKTLIDLGEMIEGHITATVIEETLVEDDNAPPDKPKPGKQPDIGKPGSPPPPPPRPTPPRDFKIELLDVFAHPG